MNMRKIISNTKRKLGNKFRKNNVEEKRFYKTGDASIDNTDQEKSEISNEVKELEETEKRYKDIDHDHVWAFIAGQYSQDFRGNPKYLFVYINRYRSDIKAYWLCSDEDTINQVRSLGFTAYKLESLAAQFAIDQTGVLVTEQVKADIPQGFDDVKYLNLWHGVGSKHIERKMFLGDIAMEMARKYVAHGTFYRDHQLMVVTAPTFVKEFSEDCGLDSDELIRTGYLRCEYQQNFEPVCSYEHDLRKVKGLTESTKLVVYAPTYRQKLGGTFARAIPDFEALYKCCEHNDLLLIFKVHPNMEDEEGFLQAWKTYGDRQRFWFWDNRNDFYEIMDQMDMAIIDYSAIFSDMAAVGIKHFIRYIFDYDEYMEDGYTQGDYFDRTVGKICYSFSELLDAIDTYQEEDDRDELQRVNDKLWAYAGGKNDFDKTIQQTMDFQVKAREFQTLYSFDIFDTLISRKVLGPQGIFALVKDHMVEHGGFPQSLVNEYPGIRHSAELNVREFYRKSQELRNSERVEITFKEIIDRIADVYCLSEEQSGLLAQWELEEELNNVVPLTDQINLVKQLKDQGETVVLICDMYLPKDVVKEMLYRADSILADLPLFLSSEYGVQKTSQKLYFEVYKSFEPFYDFKKWIHYGDTTKADITPAQKFKICPRKVTKPSMNEIQEEMVQNLGTGDAYLVAGMQARMYAENSYNKDEFVISYVALTMVPYIDWVLRDAVQRDYHTLYFISRDGYHLKRIADEIIRVHGLNIETKYIYASRRTWRIPSYFDDIDEDFWLGHGNLSDLTSKAKMLKALDLDENTFRRLFPTIDPDAIDFSDKKVFNDIREIFRDSEPYKNYLLKKAAQERVLVEGYLEQELNFNDSFAFVEYYGRGYNQDCLIRLIEDITGKEWSVPFYYMRTVLPSIGKAIRYNFSTNATAPYFMESIFANMPYKSIEEYREQQDGTIIPVITPIEYDTNLYDSMNRLLPEFASRYAQLDLRHPEDTDHLLHEFAFDYFNENKDDPFLMENIGTLRDSVTLFGTKREFAPPFTEENLEQFASKKIRRRNLALTTSISMSVSRSEEEIQKKYLEMYQILPGDDVSGGKVLSKKDIESNRNFKQKYDDLQQEAEDYQKAYEKAVLDNDNKVRQKVVIVQKGGALDGTGLDLVEKAICNQSNLEVVTVNMQSSEKSPENIAVELATARYILVTHPIAQFCKITFRDETKELMLNDVAFPLYNHNLSCNYLLKWHTLYEHLAGENDFAIIQIPSKKLKERFARNYSQESRTDYSLHGCCNTDLYYEESIRIKAHDRLQELFPESSGKKVILYMPTLRSRGKCKEWLSLIDLDVLQKLIGEEYSVVVNFNSQQFKDGYYNTIEIPGFSKMINNELSLRELMISADVIIGDYRDTFFESAILHKPVYFTTTDYENIIKSRNMDEANNFESYIFGPVVDTAYDLAKELKNIDRYDYSRMEQFRDEMFEYCDGHSVDRVVNYLISNSQ